MASAASLLDTLARLQRRAFSRLGERIPVRTELAQLPAPSWTAPELRVVEDERRVEFSFQVPGAEAETTRVYWDEESQILSVHAVRTCIEPACEPSTAVWYAEVPLGSDVDGTRAEAFLKDGTLRVFAPRVDSKPVTGLPLLAWTNEYPQLAFSPSS